MNRREVKKLVHRMASVALKERWEHLSSKGGCPMSEDNEGILRLMLSAEDLKRFQSEVDSLTERLDKWSQGWEEIDGGRFKERLVDGATKAPCTDE